MSVTSKTIAMTENKVNAAAKAPAKGGILRIKDSKNPGLFLEVSHTGRSSWLYRHKPKGCTKEIQRRLGTYRARKKAVIEVDYDSAIHELNLYLATVGRMGEGLKELAAAGNAPTLGTIWTTIRESNTFDWAPATIALKDSTWANVNGLAETRVVDITPEQVEDLRIRLRDRLAAVVSNETRGTGRMANLAVKLVAQLVDFFITSRRWPVPRDFENPARHSTVGFCEEREREVRLTLRQCGQFLEALDWYRTLPARWPQRARDYRDMVQAVINQEGLTARKFGHRVGTHEKPVREFLENPESNINRTWVTDIGKAFPQLAAWTATFEEEFTFEQITGKVSWRFCEVAADFLTVLLTSGQRSSNIRLLRWDQIDDEWVLHLPPEVTKSSKWYHIPLEPTYVVPIMKRRREASDSEWVFSNPDSGKPFGKTKRVFATIKARAGIQDNVTLHDLRRTMGSVLHETGANVMMIKDLLGHSRDSKATSTYIRLSSQDTAREQLTRAVQLMVGGDEISEMVLVPREALEKLLEQVGDADLTQKFQQYLA